MEEREEHVQRMSFNRCSSALLHRHRSGQPLTRLFTNRWMFSSTARCHPSYSYPLKRVTHGTHVNKDGDIQGATHHGGCDNFHDYRRGRPGGYKWNAAQAQVLGVSLPEGQNRQWSAQHFG